MLIKQYGDTGGIRFATLGRGIRHGLRRLREGICRRETLDVRHGRDQVRSLQV